jgi:cell wall-associated NlpC family hydrolase
MKTLFITGRISEKRLWSRGSETHDAHVPDVTSVTDVTEITADEEGVSFVNTVVRGLRATGAAAALAVGLSGVGLVVGPTAVADTVMTATTTVNVRSGASTSTAVIGVLPAGNTVTATGVSTNGWTKVSYNGRTAYISSTYLKAAGVTAAPAVVSAASLAATTLEAVNVRTGPGITYSVWTVFPKGRSISVTGVTQNGYAQLTDGHWISSTWISVAATATPSPAPAASTAQALISKTSSTKLPAITGQVRATAALMIRTTSGADFTSLGDIPAGTILNVTGTTANGVTQIVYNGAARWVNSDYIVPATAAGPASNAASVALSFALAQVGKAYAWGGNGPDAYDCSGLTTAAYRKAGISLPRTSYAQFGVGTAVSLADLRPGDLVFYYSAISHVAIYIGNGRIVHASNPTRGVVTDSVTSMPFEGGRRVA